MTERRVRVFHDTSGVQWTAYERDGGNVPGGRERQCLVFESAAAVRRVWTYPDRWDTLTDDELASLSWSS